MASAAIFLAAKLDEDDSRDEGGLPAPRIVAAANKRMKYSPKIEKFDRQVQQILDNESILLQALGFDLEDILHRNRIVHGYKHRVEAIKQSSKAAIYKEDTDPLPKSLPRGHLYTPPDEPVAEHKAERGGRHQHSPGA